MLSATNLPDSSEAAFFQVMSSGDIWTILKKFMFSNRKASNLDEYRNGDFAASNGYLSLIKENSNLIFTASAVDFACENGHLETAQYLYYYRTEGCTSNVLGDAIKEGHFEVVKWLLLTIRVPVTKDILKFAVISGNLELVKWILDNGWSSYSQELIHVSRSLEVIKYLEQEYKAVCTDLTIYNAAARGDVEIIKYFDDQGKVNYNSQAIDVAATFNIVEVVELLYNKRQEGDYCGALNMAIDNDSVEVVKWLHENAHPDDEFSTIIVENLEDAACTGSIKVIQYIYSLTKDDYYIKDIMLNVLLEAVRNEYINIVKWVLVTTKGLDVSYIILENVRCPEILSLLNKYKN